MPKYKNVAIIDPRTKASFTFGPSNDKFCSTEGYKLITLCGRALFLVQLSNCSLDTRVQNELLCTCVHHLISEK
uniref:Uncharacterized protein n=1 Tax=Arundo donax TaxID=35708 RepID=A0A0A9TF47_ARUDO